MHITASFPDRSVEIGNFTAASGMKKRGLYELA
jgi:hypothetical protein